MKAARLEKNEYILKVGSKGEIFPPKEIREKLGLVSNQPIILVVHRNSVIIRKIHSLDEILQQPAKVTISSQAWKEFRKQLSEDAEQ
jgi:AbrB family looped-hinge helix DNA binding protein